MASKYDKLFMDIADLVAKQSHCISLKVGAVLVKDNRIVSIGYNGSVAGAINCDEALAQGLFKEEDHHEWSLKNEIHAEENAILFATKYGISTDKCTLYVTHHPCDICLKQIIQAGIKKVVYKEPYKKKYTGSMYNNSPFIELEQYKEK